MYTMCWKWLLLYVLLDYEGFNSAGHADAMAASEKSHMEGHNLVYILARCRRIVQDMSIWSTEQSACIDSCSHGHQVHLLLSRKTFSDIEHLKAAPDCIE